GGAVLAGVKGLNAGIVAGVRNFICELRHGRRHCKQRQHTGNDAIARGYPHCPASSKLEPAGTAERRRGRCEEASLRFTSRRTACILPKLGSKGAAKYPG